MSLVCAFCVPNLPGFCNVCSFPHQCKTHEKQDEHQGSADSQDWQERCNPPLPALQLQASVIPVGTARYYLPWELGARLGSELLSSVSTTGKQQGASHTGRLLSELSWDCILSVSSLPCAHSTCSIPAGLGWGVGVTVLLALPGDCGQPRTPQSHGLPRASSQAASA